MKIYIITQGEYSDYHIVTTFLDENVAKKFVSDMNTKFTRYSQDYRVEKYELLGGIDEYKPSDKMLEVMYRSNDKKISFAEELNGEIGRNIYFYDEGFYIALICLELTVENVLGSEKIMSEWVAQIEYELQNTFNGDLKLYRKYYKKNISETPF